MPRRRPSQLRRRSTPLRRDTEDRGLSAVTAEALARLDDPELDPLTIADEEAKLRRIVEVAEEVWH